jgi:DNA-binding NarL/FixJ family response regulator
MAKHSCGMCEKRIKAPMHLTYHQCSVWYLIAGGLSYKEAAPLMGTTVGAIQRTTQELYRLLDADSKVQLALLWWGHDLSPLGNRRRWRIIKTVPELGTSVPAAGN